MKTKFMLAALSLCVFGMGEIQAAGRAESTTPEALIGKRLFFETRFSQAFLAQSNGNVNASVIAGDPNLAKVLTTGSALPGVFAGKTMNCRACHLEDELRAAPGGGMRTYADFSRRTIIPSRSDGKTSTTRNTPTLVGASIARDNFLLHLDGEFSTGPDLVIGGFTGRNFGWLASDHAAALKNLANVIRKDDGLGDLAKQYGGAYVKVFAGDASVPAAFQLSAANRLDVSSAKDDKIAALVGNLVNIYMQSLDFSRDAGGLYNGSPYDLFLQRNNLPRAPNTGESRADYSARLRGAVTALAKPVFVTPADGTFTTHAIAYEFGAEELAGFMLFFSGPRGAPPPAPPGAGQGRGAGNCVACHTAPEFTDFSFHNTGVTQLEYDVLHGNGTFSALHIPTLAERKKAPADAFPPSARHPDYKGTFRTPPAANLSGFTDLGLWNVFGNPDLPKPQKALLNLVQNLGQNHAPASKGDALLARTIAAFKTPGLRDLGHAQPYLHTGALDTTRDVTDFYARVGAMARANQIRNADPRLAGIALSPEEAAQVAKFLDALNEDFSD